MNRITETGEGFNSFGDFDSSGAPSGCEFERLALGIIGGWAAAESFTEWHEVEEFCHGLAMAFGRMLLAMVLGRLDMRLLEGRDKGRHRAVGVRETSIKTTLGEVTLKRRYYKELGGGHVFLLDQALGLDTVGKMSMPLVGRIAAAVAECSYREAAASVGAATGSPVSHGAVWNAIQALGGRLAEIDAARAMAAKHGMGGGSREIQMLQEEFDGVWVNMQGKDRPKGGRKAEMKLAIAYEGVEFTGKDKNGRETWDLANPLYMSGFEEAKDFYEKKEGQIGAAYNLDEIKARIMNGDGGGWVKGFAARAAESGEAHFQLDPFHVKREILRSAPGKAARARIDKLLGEGKIPEMLEHIEGLAEQAEGDAKKKIEGMLAYFKNNADALVPIKDRGLELPAPPDGLAWGGMGAMEGSVCNLVALRMKKRKASFTKKGGGNLARLICLKRGRALARTLRMLGRMALPMALGEAVSEVLSAAKAPSKDGKGDEYFARGGLPFAGAASTNGREAIKRMCCIFGLSRYI